MAWSPRGLIDAVMCCTPYSRVSEPGNKILLSLLCETGSTIDSPRNTATIRSMATTRTSSPSDLMTRLSQRGRCMPRMSCSFRDVFSFRLAPAMPCKTSKQCKHGETRGKTDEITSKFACILEASESTRLRMEQSLPNYHEDHIAGKGDN